MKLRQHYSITIIDFRNIAVLTAANNAWVNWIEKNATCGCVIYDCNFREAVYNLKKLKSNNVKIQIKR